MPIVAPEFLIRRGGATRASARPCRHRSVMTGAPDEPAPRVTIGERDQPFVWAQPTKVERAQRKLITRTSYVPAVGARKSTISLVLSQLDE
jgi:hypothetical protein